MSLLLARPVPREAAPVILSLVSASGKSRPLCRHCHRLLSRPPRCGSRGLCIACYCNAAIRALYPPLRDTKGGRPDNDCADRPPPRTGTSARPGSREKLLVLMARAAAGQGLWHPLDAPLDPETAGEIALGRRQGCRRLHLGGSGPPEVD